MFSNGSSVQEAGNQVVTASARGCDFWHDKATLFIPESLF
jgi:hypothetical protein